MNRGVLLFLFFIFIMMMYFAQAEIIEVMGDQSGVWESESIYQVIEHVYVNTGDTLIIEPGTTIMFMAHYVISVTGTLLAVGTETDSILFTYDLSNTMYDGWNHISMYESQSSGSIFSRCIFEYASVGIWCHENSNPLISDNLFRCGNHVGVQIDGASPTIINNNFDGFYKAIDAENAGAQLVICRNVITNGNVAGIYCEGIDSCLIEDNYIENVEVWGIYCCSCDAEVRNNVVKGTGNIGIYCRYQGHKRLTDNLIINGYVGVYFESTYQPELVNNTIADCKIGMYMDDENETIEITNNIFYENYIAMHLDLPDLYTFSNNLFWENNINSEGDVLSGLGIICMYNNNNTLCDAYCDLFLDPQFADPELDDYHLCVYSPALNAGNDDPEYNDPDGTIADIGAYYFPQAWEIPIAAFFSDVNFGEPALTVNFLSESSGNISNLLWDFGDGFTSNLENPVHEYTETGVYSVSLTVSGPAGTDTCIREDYIMVMPQVEVSGEQSGVWSSEYCYCVIGEINIGHNANLTIEPGTIIRFLGQHSITVTGTLTAEGTENDSIRFTSGNRRPFEGDWDSITFITSEADASVFSHVIVEYGIVGIYLHCTSLNITHCRISDNYCGIELVETIAPLINYNFINSNYEYGISIHDSSTGTISNNYFRNNYEGIFLYTTNSPVITENIFKNEEFRAITGQGGNPEISYNQFFDIPWHITLHNCDAYIHHNLFCGTGEYGIYDFGNSYNVANIYNNTFCNLTYGIKASHSADFPVMNNAFYGNNIALYTYDSIASVSYNLFYNNAVDYGGEPPLWFGVIDYANGNNDPCDENFNLFMSPEFVDPQALDFNLTEYSPCINAGNPDPQYYDPNGTICDIGAYYYPYIVDGDDDNIPASHITLTNYPNPFNPSTIIEFYIPQPETCTLKIYNIKGELVKILLSEKLQSGKHKITWDGRDNNNKEASSGIYFYRLHTAKNGLTRRMLLLK